ncbi:leucine-rich repeat extensin-like protein 7, partial [Asparagus officinalis]|uniref:leucine-rich repeat extensin-like protein 7 n=1 Tax=Asparagus officinalis TaxID=4686 RepID=UPI00098E7994
MTTPSLSLPLCSLLLLLPLSLSQLAYDLPPLNPRLDKAYIALQALKHSITSDPKNLTGDWWGPHRLHGPFPSVVLDIPSLKYLDVRFNDFAGNVPDRLFDLKLDAVFVNNNNFQYALPENIGNSTVSVLVLANTRLTGCIPRSIGNMAETLNQIVLLNSNLSSCLPPEIGRLT